MPGAHVFLADVPGVDRDDVQLKLISGGLIISGERKKPQAAQQYSLAEGSYKRLERRFGRFRRELALPKDADRRGISASVDFGVLTIVVPKVKSR